MLVLNITLATTYSSQLVLLVQAGSAVDNTIEVCVFRNCRAMTVITLFQNQKFYDVLSLLYLDPVQVHGTR